MALFQYGGLQGLGSFLAALGAASDKMLLELRTKEWSTQVDKRTATHTPRTSYKQPVTVDQDDNVGVVALQHSLNVSLADSLGSKMRPNLQMLVVFQNIRHVFLELLQLQL